MSSSVREQKVVALSLCEAMYIAGAVTTCQVVWLTQLPGDMIGTKA